MAADIRITPAIGEIKFDSSLAYTQTITQNESGTLIITGSGSPGRTDLFGIDGSSGRLFTVSDDLTDSLWSVNTIAGLPVIEAFADNTVKIGKFNNEAIIADSSSDVYFGNNISVPGTISGINVTSGADPGHTHSVYNNYDGWDLQVNTVTANRITTGENVDFIQGTGITLDLLGTSIVISSTGYGYNRATSLLPTATVFNDIVVTDGFITGISTKVLTLSDLGFTGSPTADSYGSWTAQDDDGTIYTVTSTDTLQFKNGTGIDTNFTADDVLTFTNTDAGSAQNIFKNIAVLGQDTIVADDNNDTLTLDGGSNISIITDAFTDSIIIASSTIGTDSDLTTSGALVVSSLVLTDGLVQSHATRTLTLAELGYTGPVDPDKYVSWTAKDGDTTSYSITSEDTLTFAEGTGMNVNFTADDVLTFTNTDLGSSQNIFKNIAVSGQSTVVADTNNDTLTLEEGNNIVITTNNSGDTITIASSDQFSGTVTSVAAGNGLDFTTFSTIGSIVLGTPGTTTSATTNAVTATSHTHELGSIDTGDITSGLLSVSRGGTGLGTVTSNSILTGNGTGALTAESGLTYNGSILSVSGDIGATNVSVAGDLTVLGTTYSVGTETIDVSSAYIFMNTGLIGAPAASLQSGVIIGRGTSDPYAILYDETNQQFRLGIAHWNGIQYEDASTQAAATREDNPTNTGLTYWNDTESILATSSNLTFNGSALSVTGTVAATTITGINVTSGSNPGHTHTAYDNYGSWTAQDDDGTNYTITSGDTLQFKNGTGIDTNFTADDVLTFTNTDRGSSQNIFKNIAVATQSTVVADNNNDTLTLVGLGTTAITTSGDTITITSNDQYDGTVTSISGGTALTGTVTSTGSIDHLTTTGYKHIPSGGSAAQILEWSADGTVNWANPAAQTLSANGCYYNFNCTR